MENEWVIFSGGPFRKSRIAERFLQDAIQNNAHILAADSGAHTALRLGYLPEIVIGDDDSTKKKYREELQRREVRFESASKKKDETDTELAVIRAIHQGAKKITIIGGLSDKRSDHGFANYGLLTRYEDVSIRIINGNQIIWAEKGPKDIIINGKRGDNVSLYAIRGNAEGIRVEGLEFPFEPHRGFLEEWSPLGTSNVITADNGQATIHFTQGVLLIFHTLSMRRRNNTLRL